jgi:sugar (pentulose or hexulose) kinase
VRDQEANMPVLFGLDLGTTTITAVALDAENGKLLASSTMSNDAETTSPEDKARGYSEWDADRIAERAYACLRELQAKLGRAASEVAGIGLTGQQHGMILLTNPSAGRKVLINWQDQRGEQPFPGSPLTYVERANELAGADAPRRTGSPLATGYLAVTLFWLKHQQRLPAGARACFLTDYVAGLLANAPPATDPTFAASSGAYDLTTGVWDAKVLDALGLPEALFPPVRRSGERLGGLAPEPAAALGLPTGLPVFVAIGDNQASFLGAVARPEDAVLVNVGTGGQVAAFTEEFSFDPQMETRPFPRGGFLLVSAGLCGGRSYALLEQFFREVAQQLLGVTPGEPLYDRMSRLAATVPTGAGGLCCAPFFTGSRAQPALRGLWAGVSPTNFTPGHLTRALLEGMALTFQAGYETIVQASGRLRSQLVGAGNGLRANPLLARIVAETMRLPLTMPLHQEEAAYGAALLGSVGAGIFPDLLSAGKLIQYENGR